MPKSYSYQFSYYWKITWPDEESFKKDAANYKGFKQRVKRDCRITSNNEVSLYINLKWVTTLGKMKTLFPTASSIEVSTAEEFNDLKDTEEVKPAIGRRAFKIKRKLEPTDEYSYCIRELESKPTTSLGTRRRKLPPKLPPYADNPEVDTQEADSSTEHVIDVVKKKVHLDDKIINMTNYDVSPFAESLGQHGKNNSEASTSIHGDPFLEDDLAEIIRDEEIKPEFPISMEPNMDFLMEDNLGPLKKLSKLSSDDLTPKRIRNFGLENSINPIYWEYDCQNNFSLDPFQSKFDFNSSIHFV